MRIFCVFFLLLLSLPFSQVSAENPVLPEQPAVAGRDFCRLYGSVYFERDPRRKGNAQFVIFEETEEAFANLVVYKESNKLFADAPGLWYETPNRDFADFIVFVTPNRNFADFGVHFTTIRSFAGCRD